MNRTIAAISVDNGRILVGKNGLLTVSLEEEEKPADALKRKYQSSYVDYLGDVDGIELYLAKPMETDGEWVPSSDIRLEKLQRKIIPHLMWTGLL